MSGRFRRFGRSTRRFGGFRSSRYSRGGRTSLVRRARGNIRAATQQNDVSNVVINLMHKVKAGVTGKIKDEINYQFGTVAVNVFELLWKSDFFESYSKMYDQFRITSIKVKVTPVQWNTYNQWNLPNRIVTLPVEEQTSHTIYGDVEATGNPVNPITLDQTNPEELTNGYIFPQALTVVTAWDRTGLDSSQLLLDDAKYKTTIGDKITTYSSAMSQQLVAGATFNCNRYLYPSSQQEKALYFSTSELKQQINSYGNGITNYYEITPNENWNSVNITNLYSNPNCAFKPTFLLGILQVEDLIYNADISQTTNKIAPVTFNLEFDIGVSFRGLRKSQVV